MQTFVERDVPQLGFSDPGAGPAALLDHAGALRTADIWNAADPARSLGVSEPTVRRYLDLLSGAFLVRQLPPWHENLKKRQVKSPKVYVRDSGLLHQLLGIRSQRDLRVPSEERRFLGRICD